MSNTSLLVAAALGGLSAGAIVGCVAALICLAAKRAENLEAEDRAAVDHFT